MPNDTRAALGDDANRCESRSLFMNRFANPAAKDSGDEQPRRDWFNKLCGKPALSVAAGGRSDWIVQTITTGKGQILFAQLQARLMVNMAGGVMENAGLCLDRFGLPYIPGSAVKGCARRAALAALHEWCETGLKPADEEGEENLFTAACDSFKSPEEMLAAIARVFGCSEQEWKIRDDFRTDDDWIKKRSDFAWACGVSLAAGSHTPTIGWPKIRDETLKLLGNAPNFAGTVSFLPAHPIMLARGKMDSLLDVPDLGKLELDIVTCHHGEYYASENPDKKATDTEEPVPVVFPAVAAGHVFAFPLLPLRGSNGDFVEHARKWLATGLQTFGLGAKTAAGYGWFETKPAIGEAVLGYLRDSAEAQRKGREAQADKERQDQAEAVRRKAREELNKATANMSEEESLLYTLTILQEPQFLSKLDRWNALTSGERGAIYQLMRTGKSSLWLDIRKKATEGKQKEKTRWGQFVGDIFKMAKDRKEKMPS